MEWVLFALLSALLFGSRQVAAKKILMYEHATEYLTAACMVAFLFSLFFLPKMSLSYSLSLWGLMYLKGFLFTAGWLLGSKALRHLEISYVVPLTNLSPVLLVFISIFFLDELLSIVQISGIVMIIFSAYWLQSGNHIGKLLHPLRILKKRHSVYMLIAVIIYSLCATIDKFVLQSVDPYTYLSFTFFILSFHYLLIQFFKYDGIKDIRHAFSKGKYLIIICAILMVFSDVFYYMAVAIPGAMIALIVPIKRMATLVSTLVGGGLFHDHNLVQRIIACALMIVGVVLIVV